MCEKMTAPVKKSYAMTVSVKTFPNQILDLAIYDMIQSITYIVYLFTWATFLEMAASSYLGE